MLKSLPYQTALCVDANHPSLPGHFPGRPIVPGAVLLDLAIEHAQRWLGRPVQVISLPQAKFTAPLLPQQHAHLRLTLDRDELRFTISREGATIAQGLFRIDAA